MSESQPLDHWDKRACFSSGSGATGGAAGGSGAAGGAAGGPAGAGSPACGPCCSWSRHSAPTVLRSPPAAGSWSSSSSSLRESTACPVTATACLPFACSFSLRWSDWRSY
ncbi:unnamed protein product [Closterium sp. NIES-54]